MQSDCFYLFSKSMPYFISVRKTTSENCEQQAENSDSQHFILFPNVFYSSKEKKKENPNLSHIWFVFFKSCQFTQVEDIVVCLSVTPRSSFSHAPCVICKLSTLAQNQCTCRKMMNRSIGGGIG